MRFKDYEKAQSWKVRMENELMKKKDHQSNNQSVGVLRDVYGAGGAGSGRQPGR